MTGKNSMDLGATTYGAATDVFVSADGHKKPISGPGVGNYITVAKAVADPESLHYTIVNSTGFGNNNATGTMLSPTVTRKMMQARYSASEWKAWEKANEAVRERQQKFDDDMIAGTEKPVYKFDHGVLGDGNVELAENEMHIAGKSVRLDLVSPYDDMKID